MVRPKQKVEAIEANFTAYLHYLDMIEWELKKEKPDQNKMKAMKKLAMGYAKNNRHLDKELL